jgi:hypothetical protein
MRALLAILAAGFVILAAVPAFAMPLGGLSYNIGGPAFSLSSGVGFIQRDVHVILDDKVIGEATSSRWTARLDVGPMDYFDFYGTIGAADFKLSGVEGGENNANVSNHYRGGLVTVYGGGIRPQLFPLWFFKTKLNVSADFQYAAFTTEDEIGGRNIEARYQEGQIALIVSYNLRDVIPYGGLKYNPINIDFTGTKNDLKGDMDSGVFIGADYFVTPNVFFTGELSIFSETSIFLMVGYNYPPSHKP